MLDVLYVDDEPALLELCRIFLEETGEFRVETVQSGGEAIVYLGRRVYDAVVSDYRMPDMDGIELLKQVRSTHPDIPFILFTGKGREDVVIDAINNGADFYLQKGGDPQAQFAELAHKIRQAVARRQTQEALKDSEQRLSDIINFLPDATFAIDRSGTVIAWNRAIEEMTGVSAADMLGKGEYEYAIPFYGARRRILIDLIFELDDVIASSYAHIVHEKDLLIADTTLPRPKGRTVTLMGKASPLYNRQGEIVGAIESIRDITELKSAEAGLLHAKKDWETIFRAIGHPAIVLDAHNRIIDANDATLHVTGSSLEELKGKHCYEVFHGPDIKRPPERCPFEQLRKTRSTESTELEIEALDGYFTVTCTPVFDSEGKLEKVIHIAMDITEMRRTQDELRAAYEQLTASEEELRNQLDEITIAQQERAKTEENFRILVDNAPDAMYIQTNNRFVYLNNAALRLLGASSADELLGTDTFDRIHPSFHECIRQRVKSLTVDMQPVEMLDEVYLKLDGTPVDVEVTAVPFQYGGEHGALVMVRDITVRKRVEGELQASEGKYRGIFENATVAIFQTRIDGSIATANPAFAHLLGYGTPEEAIREIPDIRRIYIHPDQRDELFRVLSAREAVADFELELRRRDGSALWASVNVRAVRESGGKISGLEGLAVDVTGRKKAEADLRENEEKYRRLVETTGTGFVILDDEGRVLDANPEYVRMTGHATLDQITGRSVIEWTAPYEKEKNAESISRCLRDGYIRNLEIDYIDASGNSIPIEINATVLRAGDNVQILTLCRDITERKRMEEDLRESEEKYRTLVEHSQDGVFIVQDVRIVFYNRAFAEMTGYNEEELIGRSLPELIAPEDRETVMARHQERMSGKGVPESYEFSILHRDGSTWIRVRMFAGLGSYRGGPAVIGTFHNVTEERKREEALRESRERLQLALDGGELGTWNWNVLTGEVIFNQRWADMLGYRLDEIEPHIRSWERLAHPDDKPRVQEMLNAHLAGKTEKYECEHRLLHKSGSWIWVLDKGKVISRDRDGNALYAAGTHLDITRRKQAEEALRESEERFRRLISRSFDAVVVHQEGRVVLANDAAARISGAASTEELVGRPVLDLVHPEFRERVAERVRQMLDSQEGTVPPIEEKFVRLDGTTVDVEAMGTATQHNGRPAALVLFRDITDRKNAEERLLESEERFRSLVKHSYDCITLLRADGKIAYESDSLYPLFGYYPRDLVGKNAFDFVHPDDLSHARTIFLNLLEDPETMARVEYRFRHADGSWVYVESVGTNRLDDPAVRGIVLNSRVITGRKLAEQALKASEERYRSVIENIQDGFFRSDREGRIVMASPSAAHIMGYNSADDILGIPILSIYRFKEDREKILKQLKNQKEINDYAIEFQKKDGTTFWGSANIHLLIDEKGEFQGTEGIIRDITERKRAEERLSRINETLLRLGQNHEENLVVLTALCGELLSADCVLYNRLQEGLLCTTGQWNAPPEMKTSDVPEGYICFDMIRGEGSDPLVVRHLSASHYARTDPNVAAYGLETYVGHPVRYGGISRGSLCAVYTRDFEPTPEDLRIIGILSTAVAQEEERKEAEEALKSLVQETTGVKGQEFFDRVVRWLCQFTGSEIALISELDAQNRARTIAMVADGMPVAEYVYSLEGTPCDDVSGRGFCHYPHDVADLFPDDPDLVTFNVSGYAGIPIRTRDGRVIGIICVLSHQELVLPPMTRMILELLSQRLSAELERWRSEEQLVESEEKFRAIFGTQQLGIMLIDAEDQRIVDINPYGANLMGRTRDEVIGRKCHSFICPAEEGKCPVCDLGQTIDSSERDILLPDGTSKPVLKTVAPLTLAAHDYIIESFIDIADLKQAERALQRANEKLNLLSSITRHDIVNQLSILQGFLRIAMMKSPDPALSKDLEKADAAATRIARQVEFTKAYQALGMNAPGWYRLGTLLENVRHDSLALSCTCPGTEIYADPMLEKVFANLVDNAIRHGQPVTRMTVSCQKNGDDLVIAVEDDGSGIPVEEKEKIFGKGYGKNTGFGLFLAREILAITGILIHENGLFGRGARFEITVPKGSFRPV